MKSQPHLFSNLHGSELFLTGLVSVVIFALILALSVQAQQTRQSFADSTRQPAYSAVPDDEKILVSTEVISLTVSVTDKSGKFVPGLDKSAFQIYENKVVQEISFFSTQDAPVSVAIIFDLSGSMSGEKIVRARDALKRFIETSHPDDDYCLIGFNNRTSLLLENTNDSEALLRRLSNVEPQGNTALYDAVALGLAQVRQGKYPKRALIVISDGEDNNSRTTFRQIRRMVQEADATIYSICIRDFIPRGVGAIAMEELAAVAGGTSFFPDNAEQMIEAFETVALELRNQYSIGYIPSSFTADGKWRKIKVKVALPAQTSRFVVRAREGYYAVSDQNAKKH